MCVIMQNFIIICQTVLETSQFFDFQDGHRPPSFILKYMVDHQIGRPNMRRRISPKSVKRLLRYRI